MRANLRPLEQQTLVITGASSGIGLATAQEAVRRGAAVVLAARNEEALHQVARELQAQGGRVAVCVTDVAQEADVERIAETALREFGGFDTWVNDAAAATFGTLEETPMADHRRAFDVNYFGLVEGSLVAARHLRQRGGGAIINLGSVLSDRAVIDQGPNCATKHAIRAFTDVLRMELERDGAPIAVTLIKPGSMHTPYPEHVARRQPLEPRVVEPARLVTGLADMLQRTLGETVELQTVSGAGLWRTLVDPGELENVLVNLAVNARDARPRGGRLTIETTNAYLDEAYVETVPEPVPPGRYVLVAVSDTGSGMDQETLARVFEPFFTTKEVGKGTGLGMSQVYGFVRQSGGHIRIYSEVGVGTTVKIYLPRAADDLPSSSEADRPELSVQGGDETILLVEDHEHLRAFSTGVLTELGYTVLAAADGMEALRLLDAGHPVDLMFTDVVLPSGLDGRRLVEAAQERRPGLKVLYTTGYTRNAIFHNGRLDPGVDLISKPFTSDALALKVRAILDR